MDYEYFGVYPKLSNLFQFEYDDKWLFYKRVPKTKLKRKDK